MEKTIGLVEVAAFGFLASASPDARRDAMGGDPVKLGLVASYNRPGGNATGDQ